MITQTPSQIAQQYVLNTYPCLNAWVSFVQNAFVQLLNYSPTACSQVSSISRSAMKAIEYIQQNDSNAKVVRVMRMLNDLSQSAWEGWTAFAAQSNIATGIRTLGTTPIVLTGIALFEGWDAALVTSPTFNPPMLLNQMLGGITP